MTRGFSALFGARHLLARGAWGDGGDADSGANKADAAMCENAGSASF